MASNIERHNRKTVMQPAFTRPPQAMAAPRVADQPQRPIGMRHMGIAYRRLDIAGWVRMIMAQHFGPVAARAPVRADQDPRVDFEPARRILRDIGCGKDGGYRLPPAQQKATNLPFRTGLCLVQYPRQQLS